MEFNPFEDRYSRNVRNDLSSEFAAAIESQNTDRLVTKVEFYKSQNLAPCYQQYIDDRYARYQTALSTLVHQPADPIVQGIVLWNNGLFFEFHEVLEQAWMKADGTEKLLLQALIRAAGVYIKREYGYNEPAARIAAKAVAVLREYGSALSACRNVDTLIAALEADDAPPPFLQSR